jgi:hypothetical protein
MSILQIIVNDSLHLLMLKQSTVESLTTYNQRFDLWAQLGFFCHCSYLHTFIDSFNSTISSFNMMKNSDDKSTFMAT